MLRSLVGSEMCIRDRYSRDDYTINVERFDDVTYTELAMKERQAIAELGGNTYNRTPGGEIRIPRQPETTVSTQPFHIRDVAAYGVYSAFGILPEATYTHRQQAEKTRKRDEQEDTWTFENDSVQREEKDDDIPDITDAVLNEINQQQRSGYSTPLNGTANQPIANDPQIDVSETTTEILNELAKRQRTLY